MVMRKLDLILPPGSLKKKREAKDSFLFVKGEDPSKMLVLFSAANAKSFSLYKNLEDYKKYDKLFVRDPYSNNWFQNGVGPYAADPDKLAKRILAHTRSRKTKVYAAGVSMGGYAALLFACLGKFEAALAIVPQTRLRNNFFRNPPHGVNIHYPDLAHLIEKNKKTQFHILAGSEDYIDICSISLLPEQKNIKTYIFPKLDHSLPILLNKKFGVGNIIKDFIERKPLVFNMKEKKFNHKQPWLPYLQRGLDCYLVKKYGESEKIIKSALEQHPDWIAGHIFLARIYSDMKKMDLAEQFWLKALNLYPRLTEPNSRLGKLYQERGELEKARQYYSQFLKVRKTDKNIKEALKEIEGMM